MPLAGGPMAFAACEAIWEASPGELRREILPTDAVAAWARSQAAGLGELAEALLQQLSLPRPAFAAVSLERPRLMGIINVTPDSFSDGGERFDSERAVADGLAMRDAGADILDVGGESTRPGAEPVPLEQELARVIPVVRALAEAGATVSIDTRHAAVMRAALKAGARIVNDVTALAGDPESLSLVAGSDAAVVLMHMRGDPRTMQQAAEYDDVVLAVYDALAERVDACLAAGIARERIAVDPGIGFAKTAEHNLQLLEQLAIFHGLGCALLLGASRKSFIAHASASEPPKDRLGGSLAAALAGAARGAHLLRVHDIAATRQAVAVWYAIETRGESLHQ